MLWNAERTWEAIRRRNRQRPAGPPTERKQSTPRLTFPHGTDGPDPGGAQADDYIPDPALTRHRIARQPG
jgi:hypothetical protein